MATKQVLNDTHYFLCEDYIIKIGSINGRKNTQDNKKRVIMQWLYGISRDQIAKANQIGAGTVSAIIKQCKLEEQQKKNMLLTMILNLT